MAGRLASIVLVALATVLSVVGIAYGWLWTTQSLLAYDVLSHRLGLADNALVGRRVELGCDIEYSAARRGVEVTLVRDASPARAAGLRAGDLVVSVDGRSLRESADPLGEVYLRRRPGDAVVLGVIQDGREEPVVLEAVFRARSLPESLPTLVRLLFGTTVLFPFVLLAVALPVLFYRLHDRNAWLLAALFLGLAAAPSFPNGFLTIDGAARQFAMTYRAVWGGVAGPLFYALFAVFPVRSPIDRRAPWLKWLLLGVGVAFGVSGIPQGNLGVPATVADGLGSEGARRLGMAWGYLPIALGLASLLSNAWRPATADARRKIQVITWGTVAGILPAMVVRLLQDLGWRLAEWLMPLAFLLLFLFPLSFAYAVVRHRVLELPVLLRRSARYVLVRRGFAVLLVLLALVANALFAYSFTRLFRVDAVLATSVGVGFGLLLASVSAPGVRGATTLIDRAFFREAYDTRVLLEELTERIRTAESQPEIGALLEDQLSRALHPRSITAYLHSPDERLRATGSGTPEALADTEALEALVRLEGPTDFLGSDGEAAIPALAPLGPECLVPIATHGRLLGLVVLGSRLSEEPYSGEDKRLLATVAAHAAIALENLALATRMAERLEGERRAAHEMELARRVQVQLLPRVGRRLRTLECVGRCVQAREVGGDYFDFMDGAEGRLGLVLADVSGKGFAAALLMAGLQASLRTLFPRDEDLGERLVAVNHLLVEATELSRYATLFLGEFEEGSRRLRFVNCGHNPPLVLRSDGRTERLLPTAMVVGLVEPWTCEIGGVTLDPGDVVVAYSDGITEAADRQEREFGEERLLEAAAAHRERPLEELLDAVYDAVRSFSHGEQADDQTLLVARAL